MNGGIDRAEFDHLGAGWCDETSIGSPTGRGQIRIEPHFAAYCLAHGFKQENMSEGVRKLMKGAMPNVVAASLGAVILFVAARIYTGLWSNADGLEVFDAQLRSVWFWLELIALVGSFLVLLNRRLRGQGSVQILTAAAVLVALFIGRYEFVVSGQVVPLFKGSWVPGLIEYTPSLSEWMLVVLSLYVTLLIYAVGEKMFNLGGSPRSAS